MKITDPKQQIIDRITKELAAKGKILEGGWQAFVITSGLDDAPEMQKREMRKAYFLGAQHLFASILGILEPGAEATENDLNNITKIADELKAFTQSIQENRN